MGNGEIESLGKNSTGVVMPTYNMDDKGYPRETYRRLADCLTPSNEVALSIPHMTEKAIDKGLIRSAHKLRLYFALKRHINNYTKPEAQLETAGADADGWFTSTWQKCLYLESPSPTKGKYIFLIGRTEVGEIHHASSLAATMVEDDLEIQRIECTLDQAKRRAYTALSRLRRKKLHIEPTGRRGPGLGKRNFDVTYDAWDTDYWKFAAGLPVHVENGTAHSCDCLR